MWHYNMYTKYRERSIFHRIWETSLQRFPVSPYQPEAQIAIIIKAFVTNQVRLYQKRPSILYRETLAIFNLIQNLYETYIQNKTRIQHIATPYKRMAPSCYITCFSSYKYLKISHINIKRNQCTAWQFVISASVYIECVLT